MNPWTLPRIVTAVALATCTFTTAHAASLAPVAAEHGMVVTAQHLASRVGVDVLKDGGNAVVGIEAEERDRKADGVGQEYANVVTAPGDLGEPAPEHQAGEDQPAIGESVTVGILEDDGVHPVPARSIDETGK